MSEHDPTVITILLEESRRGSSQATERLLELAYPSLKAIAAVLMRGEDANSLHQMTALVHEAHLRLFNHQSVNADSRAYFFYIASRAMRQTLVDCARERLTREMGRLLKSAPREDAQQDRVDIASLTSTIAVGTAIEQLSIVDERAAKVVDLHYFCDLSLAEVADVLQIGEPAVQNDWNFAKSWLKLRLQGVK